VARARAIRRLVRPQEVRHFIHVVPNACLPLGHALANEVGRWFRQRFSDGTIRYIADPKDSFDHWCSPAATLARGGGDCDDLAILATSLLLAGDVNAHVVVGRLSDGWRRIGHAWVEGIDESGGFLLEATSGRVVRGVRPAAYRVAVFLGPDFVRVAA
jgi:transglutaminase-like putative cysteine protease